LSVLPIHRLTKAELVWLAQHRCEAHRHKYIEHYSCFISEHPKQKERLAFFDIEASNLDADYGIMLSWAIKPSDSKIVIGDVLTPEDVRKGHEDKRIVQTCIDALNTFDRVVTYYGTGFDLPFLRARALIVGVDFPSFGTLKHKDVYYTLKSKFKLSSRRLENACRQLLGKTDKTRIDAKYWRNGVRGEAKSLRYIYTHNRFDVLDLEKLYYKVLDFSKINNTSI
jgi:uncharacterized protein YprB with RNaseH-like and TPR domain